MSMRTYGIETKGVVLRYGELVDLLKANKNTIKGLSSEEIDNEEYELIDFTYDIDFATYYSEFDGYIDLEQSGEREYFEYEDIILLELKKNNLFEKYENQEEIYDELIDTLKQVGINVDRDYIVNHYGYINGTETS